MFSFLKEPKSVFQKIGDHERHKRNALKIRYKKGVYTIAEFAELAKVPYMTMYMRVKGAESAADLKGEVLIKTRKRGRPVEA